MPCELENLALRIWLCLYNQMLGLSWLYVLFQIVQNLFVGGLESMNQTWDDLQASSCRHLCVHVRFHLVTQCMVLPVVALAHAALQHVRRAPCTGG
eukprot:1407913-Rhodomonas_salina.4